MAINDEANEKIRLHNPEKEAKSFAEALVGIVKSQQNRIEFLERTKAINHLALLKSVSEVLQSHNVLMTDDALRINMDEPLRNLRAAFMKAIGE